MLIRWKFHFLPESIAVVFLGRSYVLVNRNSFHHFWLIFSFAVLLLVMLAFYEPSLVVASVDKMLHDDCLCLGNLASIKLKKSEENSTGKTSKQRQLLSESGFILRKAPLSLSRDSRIKMKKSPSSQLFLCLIICSDTVKFVAWNIRVCNLTGCCNQAYSCFLTPTSYLHDVTLIVVLPLFLYRCCISFIISYSLLYC